VFYALLPWPFYAFERLRFRKHRDLHALLGALTLSGLAFTHPGYAFWATAFFAIYITIRRIQSPLPLPHILLLFGGGIILGAYLTLPMWIEKNATGLYIGFAMTHVQDPNWQQLLYWSNHRFALFATEATHQTWYGGYMGLSLTLLALVGLITPVLPGHRHLRHPAIPLCFFGTLLLVFGYRWPILRSLTVVQALNSGRYLLFVAFFMCALAGITTAYLTHIRWHRTRTFTIILLIIIIDLFPTTFQHPYLPDKGNDPDLISLSHTQHQTLNQANADLPKSQLPSYRTFYTVSHTYPAVVTGWMINNLRQPSIYALYNERPLAGPALTDPFAAYANERLVNMPDPAALMRHPDWQTILRGFYLLNIQYVVITQEQDAHTWQMPTATPIVVSGRAHPISDQTTDPQFIPLPELLHAYGDIDESARRCDQIPILNHEDNLATQPSVQVLEHQVWNQRMVLRVNISQDCYARLAYAHYPYTNVYVNGKQTIPLKTTDYFIALKLKAGQHTIELVPSLSPLRKGLLTLNIVLLSVAIYFIWRRSKPIKQE
ncbi:MAG: hypothetical protein QGG64_08300, partial [Candidatus Latescibacteria bacterium]|nr:hypothetical protein [Candidatus Latescibacterota bacterium]